MGRVALLFGVTLLGCSSVVPAPPLLPKPNASQAPALAPDEALSDAQLQEFVTEHLGQLAYALEPLCGTSCRSLRARPDPDLESWAALQLGQPLIDSVVLYRPEVFQGVVAYSESLAMQALAHEMGHYVDLVITGEDAEDPWRRELAAETFGGCAFATLRLPVELVRTIMLALATPENSMDAQLNWVCGFDSLHPAMRWALDAFDTGTRLCKKGVAPLERLESEVSGITHDAKRAAQKARKWFPPLGDPCRWRHLDDSLRILRIGQ